MTLSHLRRPVRGGLALAALLAAWGELAAQTAAPTPPPKPMLAPQTFQPNITNTEGSTDAESDPNIYSPWFDTMEMLRLPDTFDPEQAAKEAREGSAEAVAAAMSEPPIEVPEVAFADLFVETTEGSLLATPEGSAFSSESLLLTPGGGGFGILSKEASLPYGEYNYPMIFSPRAVPVFKRERVLQKVGPLRVGLDLGLSAAYNDNVFGQSENTKGDMIFTFQPAIYLEAGTKGSVQLLYAPTFVNFSRYKELSSANQAVFLRVRYPFTKLQLGSDIFYLSQSGLFLNSEGFAEQQTFVARFFGEYPLTKKISLGLMEETVVRNTDPGGRQLEQSIRGVVYYQMLRTLKVGASAKLGTFHAPSDNQTFETIGLNAAFKPDKSFLFLAEIGVQSRQLSFDADGRNEFLTPVFDLQAIFNPTSELIFNVTFYRDVLNTTFNDVSLNVTTGINVSTVIHLFDRVNLRFEGGIGLTEQFSDEESNDGHFYFAQGGLTLSYQILKAVEFQIFDNFQRRFGSQIGEDYISNTIGAGITFKF